MRISQYLYKTLPIFVALLVCPQLSLAADAQTYTLAIVSGSNSTAPSQLAVAKMEVALSAIDQVQLIERNQVDRILDEIELQLSGLTDVKRSSRVSELLPADLILFMDKLPEAADSLVRIRLVESKTGIILNSSLHTTSTLTQDVTFVPLMVKNVLEKHRIPLDDRIYVSVLGIKSEELGSALDGSAQALELFMVHDLATVSNIIVLDREHFKALQDEQDWAGLQLKLKGSSVVIEGAIKYTQSRNAIQLNISLRSLAGGSTAKLSLDLPNNDILRARSELSALVLNKLNLQEDLNIVTDPKQEATLYLKQIPFLLSSGNYHKAVQNAEVAYALNATQSSRFWAARAWYAWGKKLAREFQTKYWQPGWKDASYGMSVGNTQREEFHTNVMKTVSVSRDTWYGPTSVHREDMSDEQKIEALIAIQRSYSFMHQMVRFHSDRIDQGLEQNVEFPDPLKLKILPTLPVYWRKDGKTTVELESQSGRFMKYYNQVIRMEGELYDYLIDFYGKHYAHSRRVQHLYWTAWMRKSKLIQSYYQWKQDYWGNFAEELLEHAANLPSAPGDIKYYGVKQLIGSHVQTLDNRDPVYAKMRKYKDPAIRKVVDTMFRRQRNPTNIRRVKTVTKPIPARKPKRPQKAYHYAGYKVKATGVKVPYSRPTLRHNQHLFGEGELVNNNIIVEGAAIYVLQTEKVSKTSFRLVLYRYDFLLFNMHKRIGEAVIDIRETDPMIVTATTVGPDHVYVGTAGGLTVFNKKGGEVRQYTEENGFPDNRILSLAYHRNNLYIGIGPILANEYGWVGKSGLAMFSMANQTYQLIASNGRLQKKNELDGGSNYKITDLLVDKKNNVLWLAVSAHEQRSGLWRYDMHTGVLEHVVREHSGIKKMIWRESDLVYSLYEVGLVSYSPLTQTKEWLLCNANKFWHTNYGRNRPWGIQTEPIYGYHAVSLLPMTVDAEHLFAMRGNALNIFHKGKVNEDEKGESLNDVDIGYPMDQIKYLARAGKVIWLIRADGEIVLIKSR